MRPSPGIVMSFITITVVTCGCARPRVEVPNAPLQATIPDWVDLEPGWRVRVVTPLLSSGGYLVKTAPSQGDRAESGRASADASRANTGEIALSTGADFTGYEVSLYSVKPHRGGGVHVVFDSAEIHRQGQVTRSRQPVEPLFRFPREALWVRILHLARGSHDYDSAILAANRRDRLADITRQVQSDPSACRSEEDVFCFWIPRGIAAIPESRKEGEGGQWVSTF